MRNKHHNMHRVLCSNEQTRLTIWTWCSFTTNYNTLNICLYFRWPLLSIIEQHQMNFDEVETNVIRLFLRLMEGQTFDHINIHFSHLEHSQKPLIRKTKLDLNLLVSLDLSSIDRKTAQNFHITTNEFVLFFFFFNPLNQIYKCVEIIHANV